MSQFVVSNQDLITVVVGIIIAVLTTFLAGGATVVVLATVFLDKIANSPVVIAYLKHLADSASPELLKLLTEGRDIVDETIPQENDPHKGVKG